MTRSRSFGVARADAAPWRCSGTIHLLRDQRAHRTFVHVGPRGALETEPRYKGLRAASRSSHPICNEHLALLARCRDDSTPKIPRSESNSRTSARGSSDLGLGASRAPVPEASVTQPPRTSRARAERVLRVSTVREVTDDDRGPGTRKVARPQSCRRLASRPPPPPLLREAVPHRSAASAFLNEMRPDLR